jgi:type IX secretion system PorP/SprF family membrane protein
VPLAFISFLISMQHSFAQQNIQLTQYFFNTLSVNPAYAGYKEDWYIQADHRMQWMGMDGAPVTTQLSIDGVTDVVSKNMGVGLQLTSDRLGPQSATSVYADYAYRLQLDKADMSRLSFGLSLGLTQYSTDVEKLRAVDPNDPLLTFENSNSYIPDIRFGIYYYNPKFYVGLSFMDLLAGTDSSSIFKTDSTVNVMRRTHCYLIGGGLFEINDYTKFRPGFMIREDFKGPTNLDLSATFIFDNRFWIGGTYRTGLSMGKKYAIGQTLSSLNAITGHIQFQVNDKLRVGYSYDYALNSLSSIQSGSHEFSVGLLLSRKARRVLSPRFF